MKPRETHPPFLLTSKGLVLGLLVLALMGTGFVLFTPSHAAIPNPTVANTGTGTWVAGSTYTVGLTVGFSGDVVALMVDTGATVSGTNPVTSDVTSPSVTGGHLLFSNSVPFHCIGAAAFCDGVGNTRNAQESLFVGKANAAGAITLTVVLNSATANQFSTAQAFDIEFSGDSPSATSTKFCDATSGGDCGSPAVGPLTSGATDVLIVGAGQYGSAFVSASGSCGFVGPGNSGASAFFNGVATCGLNYNGGTGANSGYGIVAATFSPGSGVVVSTSVINTGCLGACSGGSNSTSTFSVTMPNLYVYQASQNVASPAQVDNFTMKVSSVHITTSTGTIYVVTCMPVTPTTPASGGNLWSCFNPKAVSITNNTSNFFIHANPQTLICSSCYYAVGIFTPTTASRGSGAAGAGIAFYETSQTGLIQYTYAVGSSTPPTTFFSSTVVRPNLFMYIHTTFTVATITNTSTFTLTSGASTLITSTTTLTSTTLDENLAVSTGVDFSIMILILMAPAMALTIALGVVTRSPQGAGLGFVAGLAIGAGVGNKVGLVPPVLVGVTVIVMIFILVGVFALGKSR